MLMKIPQVDPKASYLAHQIEIDAAIAAVMASGWFILGKETAAFEQEFARFLGAGHAVGVANGTDAVEIALRACGIGPGDAVVTVSHTAVATVAAVELAGAVPVLADIDPQTFTLSPESLEATIRAHLALPASQRPALKAVLAVHLYGHPANLPALQAICERHGLSLIEDCAQSHGAMLHGRMTGTWGRAAAFSFYPTKNLGALGDGGAVVTNDPAVAEKARLLREYGWQQRYISSVPGMNSRLDELQSAILRAKLRHLADENHQRRAIARQYNEALGGTPLQPPREEAGAFHVYHQYVVRTPARESLRAFLKEREIGTLVHYPVPVHLQPAYQHRLKLAPDGLPHTEAAAREVLSLPMFPQLSADKRGWVAEQVAVWSRNEAGKR
jgi:dTDP-4-amino-4,6-dideoxygalactose transaminase